ncbi:hypothetical protein [Vibrio sp. TRT 29B02]|uniref:hypothetical protein n=1 Tax=Vibrio sp. TRT 29B02 TaxID=3418508 RepID=UPI003CFBAF1E
MKISNLNALKETVVAARETLAFMNADTDKVNCLIEAKDCIEMALDDLKQDGVDKGGLSAIQSLEDAVRWLERAQEFAIRDTKKEANVVDELIASQCRAIIPMADSIINNSLSM